MLQMQGNAGTASAREDVARYQQYCGGRREQNRAEQSRAEEERLNFKSQKTFSHVVQATTWTTKTFFFRGGL